MRRLELALALDNTGSMLESGKLDALKNAANSLLDTLEKASRKKDDIKVSIIPFTTYVNVDPKGNKKAKWIDFAGWTEVTSIGMEAGLSSDWINPKTGQKWAGCVTDRNQPYDVQDTAPSGTDTLFPAADCVNPVPFTALTSDWRKLHQKVEEMKGDGTTNVTIGLAWGWHSLTSRQPLSEGAAPGSDLDKVLVLLTDGENTENRWGANSAAIDKRTETACANIKADGIKLYTVRVIAGNAKLLKNCASSPSMYFEVSQAAAAQCRLQEDRGQPGIHAYFEIGSWHAECGPVVGRMSEPSVIVRSSPQGGFRWRVVVDGQTVGSGSAPTEFEARNAADEIVKRIEAKPPEAP